MDKPLILVVDDEVEVANFITDTIKNTGQYEVITAYSGPEALKRLQENKIMLGLGGNRVKLCFLDIKMPGMDGLTLLEKIRHDFGEDIGISMLTAWEDADKWERATSGFVINYLKKPFKKEDLLNTIDRFFAGKEGELTLQTFEKHIEKRKEFKAKNS